MTSEALYGLLVGLVVVERLAELIVSKRHATWAFERGGTEFGKGHYPPMVLLHSAFLIACLVEVLVVGRPFDPVLGSVMLALVIASQALRWWCITTLGKQWNTRVIVVPGLPLVRRGPYRWVPHPNYVAVVVEGLALPLVHSAWVTALAFTMLNALLLWGFRIPVERRALDSATARRGSCEPVGR